MVLSHECADAVRTFFKYVFLWLLPATQWTSIDMRESFQRSFLTWYSLAIPAYLAWAVVAVRLLLQRGNRGLLGFAMLAPWLLFATELVSIRIQEPFVLYRSYLWAAVAFATVPVCLNAVNRHVVALLGFVILFTFFIQSMERLATFSNPILVWEDAKKLLRDKPDALGSERIYYNLGRHLLLAGKLDASESNIRQAISIDPDFAQAHGVLAAVYIQRKSWDLAIQEYNIARQINQRRGEPPSSVYLVGRAKAYEGSGQLQFAIADYLEACRINFQVCEMLRKSSTPID